jgi:hypothetical protein
MTTNERGLFESLAVFAAALSALGVFLTVYDAVQPGQPEPKICRDADSLKRVPCRFTGEGNAVNYDQSLAALLPPVNRRRPSDSAQQSAQQDQALANLVQVNTQRSR